MNNRVIECVERADYLLSSLTAVKPGEEVLIAIDPQTDMRMANATTAVALKCDAGYNISMMPIRRRDKATTFPKTSEKVVEAYDVFVGMTTASGAAIYDSRLKRLINGRRLREVSIYLWNADNSIRDGAFADYEKVYADGLRLQEIWREHKIARATAPTSMNITMEMDQMESIIECDIARNPDDATAWLDEKVSFGPIIGMTEGTVVVGGSIRCYGYPTTPVKLRMEKGRIVEVVDGNPKICKEIRHQIKGIRDSNNIVEIGLGLNPAHVFNGDSEEEEKARRTLHFAMGNDFYYGQLPRSTAHTGMVLYNPAVYFGDVLVEKGSRLICLGEE